MTTITAPHTGAARDVDGLAVVGRTLHDLRGIRFDDGEGGNVPAGGAPATDGGENPAGRQSSQSNLPGPGVAPSARQGDPTPGAAPTSTPTPTPSGDPAPGSDPAPSSTPTPGQQQQYTPEQTQQYIASLRQEAKTNRERAEAAEAARNTALQALGLQMDAQGNITPIPKQETPAPVVEAQTERDNTQRENLVLRIAPSLKADADKMLDSRSFASQLSQLDPTDRAGAEALVREWLEGHPEHAIAPAPAAASGGTQHAGGAPVNGRKSREEALKARMDRQQAVAS